MNRHVAFVITAFAVLSSAATVPTGALAQEKQQVSFKVAAANTKYTQQHTIDVGDIPGHQVRVFEIHREFGKDGPIFAGTRVIEQWTRAFSDFTDLNGPALIYNIFVLENGDKFFTRGNQVTESVANPDGSIKSTSHVISRITGGTGKYRDMRGVLKSLAIANIKAGINEVQVDAEYWMDK
jgi:hypothetical protein